MRLLQRMLCASFFLMSARTIAQAAAADPDRFRKAAPAVAADVPTAAQTAVAPQKFALGVGYPDLRARYNLTPRFAVDGKFAFADGIQVYSARLAWNFIDVSPFKFVVGAESGWAKFEDLDGLSGTGTLVGGFLGVEYPFAKRFRLSMDVGPAWMQAGSEGKSYSTTDVVYNTALYIFLF